MDTRAHRTIEFDASGLCQHCRRYNRLVATRTLRGEEARRALSSWIERMKTSGREREYDCIIGVSGGADSTYVAYLVRQYGLRALAVHFDNGWDSELAVKNIERVLDRLGIDLYTYVVDWEEFKDLQISFLRASTPDGEIPSDHAINALMWGEAARRGIPYVITGMNFITEGISVPEWAYGHSDWRYINDVHRRFGTVPLKTYPHFSLPKLLMDVAVRRIRMLSILNYVDYRKSDAMATLQKELGWKYYGGKHHESIYTRFYQGYILPRKFGIDKRVGHLSDLINAGQITKAQALEEMKEPPYAEELQQQDRRYVCKKLGFTEAEFDAIIRAEPRSFRDYKNSYAAVELLRNTVNKLRSSGLYPR